MCSGVVFTKASLVMRVSIQLAKQCAKRSVTQVSTFKILSCRCRSVSFKTCWLTVGLTLVLWLPGSSLFAEQSAGRQVNRFDVRQIADWVVATSDISMTDGSLLREYLASSDELELSGTDGDIVNGRSIEENSTSRIEFVFLPRFLCSPLIRVVRNHSEKFGSSEISSGVDARVDSGVDTEANAIVLEIDNEPVKFPALIEPSGLTTRYFYNVNLQRRATLRVLVELGNQMLIVYSDGEVATISLKGSQRALETASANCLKY